jgi:hypothetical protein
MTITVLTVVIAVLVLALALFAFRAIPAVQTYFKLRGQRLLTCPQTQSTAAVEVAATEAALGAFVNEPTLRLKQCSRWPERENCGQECLEQIEADPRNCLVWNIARKWYEGKSCVFCHKPIGGLRHLDHVPALLGPDFKTSEWKDVAPQDLPKVFSTYPPVFWNCHVTETFRRLHPRLVTDRSFKPSG